MPNDDYIKRSDAIKTVRYYKNCRKENCVPSIDDAHLTEHQLLVQAINNIPAADVELVRHGKWIEYKHEGQMAQYCSECGSDPGVIYLYGRCPICGAYMNAKRNSQ